MTLQLYFNPSKFPRTINRKEWKEIWRWKRVTEKDLDKHCQKMYDNFAVYGSTWPDRMRDDFLDEMINPPLVSHDKQGL